MALYNELLPEFRRFRAEILGISVDGVCGVGDDPFARTHQNASRTSDDRCGDEERRAAAALVCG